MPDRIEEAIKLEAEEWIRRQLGALYDMLPESVKREMEREYVQRRAAEMGVRVKPAIAPALLIGGLLLALFLLPTK